MSIILCGLPGCGKTTLGKQLADQLKFPFIDTDQLIEEKAQRTCREIYHQEGEVAFRQLEKEVIQACSFDIPSVIAIGGGTLLDESNRNHLQRMGKIVYLFGSLDFLYSRLMKRGTPAYLSSKEDFDTLAAQRVPIFESVADAKINIESLSTEEIFNQIWQVIHSEKSFGSLLGANPTVKRSELS